ncbi:hypothetical protein Mp_7g03800 [Marchantia polymorpha subsp. ruderalis]|uniref:Uncharacterized protein n=2 Tax=Marchantia polymorpha TaxID=3197 RepID=A0AAF6BVW0_MARPO|nr:hypothetical protein MARPO_0074s0017 [Marchantia polymorpha]BBN16144.1 hypothetical protein Mp_7g03800 [Marchantia polymorpha subsp. ruderalis]|eukprot:PTQ35021.1 hypothetical protein MARPO_0074s0017 [Marchantia polymorpha]
MEGRLWFPPAYFQISQTSHAATPSPASATPIQSHSCPDRPIPPPLPHSSKATTPPPPPPPPPPLPQLHSDDAKAAAATATNESANPTTPRISRSVHSLGSLPSPPLPTPPLASRTKKRQRKAESPPQLSLLARSKKLLLAPSLRLLLLAPSKYKPLSALSALLLLRLLLLLLLPIRVLGFGLVADAAKPLPKPPPNAASPVDNNDADDDADRDRHIKSRPSESAFLPPLQTLQTPTGAAPNIPFARRIKTLRPGAPPAAATGVVSPTRWPTRVHYAVA